MVMMSPYYSCTWLVLILWHFQGFIFPSPFCVEKYLVLVKNEELLCSVVLQHDFLKLSSNVCFLVPDLLAYRLAVEVKQPAAVHECITPCMEVVWLLL